MNSSPCSRTDALHVERVREDFFTRRQALPTEPRVKIAKLAQIRPHSRSSSSSSVRSLVQRSAPANSLQKAVQDRSQCCCCTVPGMEVRCLVRRPARASHPAVAMPWRGARSARVAAGCFVPGPVPLVPLSGGTAGCSPAAGTQGPQHRRRCCCCGLTAGYLVATGLSEFQEVVKKKKERHEKKTTHTFLEQHSGWDPPGEGADHCPSMRVNPPPCPVLPGSPARPPPPRSRATCASLPCPACREAPRGDKAAGGRAGRNLGGRYRYRHRPPRGPLPAPPPLPFDPRDGGGWAPGAHPGGFRPPPGAGSRARPPSAPPPLP